MNCPFESSTLLSSTAHCKVRSDAVITVRTSNKSYKTIGSGVAYGGGEPYPITNAYGIKRTTSFVAIQKDISDLHLSITSSSTENNSGGGIPFPGTGTGGTEPPYTPPTGELDSDHASPIGDVLLPLLLMAAIYVIRRFFRNRKHIQSAK